MFTTEIAIALLLTIQSHSYRLIEHCFFKYASLSRRCIMGGYADPETIQCLHEDRATHCFSLTVQPLALPWFKRNARLIFTLIDWLQRTKHDMNAHILLKCYHLVVSIMLRATF